MLAHERRQFALYRLMLLHPLQDPGASVQEAPHAPPEFALAVRHPLAPPTTLLFAPSGALTGARNRVRRATGEGEIEQAFSFDGRISSGGVRWPRRIRIEQDGAPYFELRLTSFEAG